MNEEVLRELESAAEPYVNRVKELLEEYDVDAIGIVKRTGMRPLEGGEDEITYTLEYRWHVGGFRTGGSLVLAL